MTETDVVKEQIRENEELNELLEEAEENKPETPKEGKVKHDEVPDAIGEPTQKSNGSTREYVQWSSGDGSVFFPTNETRPKLIPGYYEIGMCPTSGIFFRTVPVLDEGLIRFPDAVSEKVIGEIEKFWDREDIFKKYKIAYKRGIILYGPPGGGKSCTIQIICRLLIERGGVVLKWSHVDYMSLGLRAFKKIQPDTPLIVMMEDMDSIVENTEESKVLNILDGVDKIDKVIFLATTNYPERLGARIINRPSRFDKRFKIGTPNVEARKMYFDFLTGNNGDGIDDMDKWVKDTEGLSIAHLKELFVAVNIIGDPYELAIKTIQSMRERVSSEQDEFGPVGFAPKKRNRNDGTDSC